MTTDLTITSLETIQAYDVATGDFLFELDELQSTSIAQAQETTDLTGKQGRKLAKLKKNKTVTISGANGMVSAGLMGLQTGSPFVDKAATIVRWSEPLVAKATQGSSSPATTEVSLNYAAVGASGNEIRAVYLKDSKGAVTTKLVQNTSAASGKFAYANKKITFLATDVPEGAEVYVTYDRKIAGAVMENKSDVYSSKATLYIDAMGEDKCGNVYRVQFYIPKADFSGEFTLEMGDNQTVHNFEAEALANACGLGGNLYTYTIFGANAEDVA